MAVLTNQGIHSIAGLLGGIFAGKCVLPLDPKQPAERLRAIIKDADCQAILTRANLQCEATDLITPDRTILSLDEIPRTECDQGPETNIEPESPAVLLYTSGSTGQPKGVLHTHGSILQNTIRHTALFNFHHTDHQTLLYPCGVYGGTRDIFNALLNGACLYQRDIQRAGTVGLADWIAQSGITLYCSVATVFRHMVQSLPPDLILENIRAVKLGGEAPQPRDIEAFRNHFSKDARLHCGLASTETGTTFHFLVGPDMPIDSERIPLGTPVPGVEVRVLDTNGNPVPPGEVGELEVSSSSIARGYLHPVASNAHTFGVHASTGERTFRTGDLVYQKPDGLFEHRGRKDLQIKIRGNRVEISEVEQAITSLNQIKEAAVVPVTGPHGTQLIACIVMQPHESISSQAEKQDHAQQAHHINAQPFMNALLPLLSEHKVPTQYLVFTKLPQTSNGKLDRQLLAKLVLKSPKPAPESTSSVPLKAETSPSELAGIENRLQGIWEEVFSTTDGSEKDSFNIRTNDNFFELGGHSLLAVEVLHRVERAFGVFLSISVLFEAPTITLLATRIRRASLNDSTTPPVILIPMDELTECSKPHRPFFCAHGIGGDVLFLKPLADALGATQPIYGFQSSGVHSSHHNNVQALAEQYIAAMRGIQPTGPYRIGGYSFGGSIALEIAQQLIAKGETVEVLVIIDHAPRNTPDRLSRRSPISIAQQLANIPYWILDDLLQSSLKHIAVRAYGQCMRAMTQRLQGKTSTLTHQSNSEIAMTEKDAKAQMTDTTGPIASDFNPAAYFGVSQLSPEFAKRVTAHYTANHSYVPKKFDGQVLVYEARTSPLLHNRQIRRCWRYLSNTCRFVTIPGSHGDLFIRPDTVRLIARELRREFSTDSSTA